MRLVTFSESSTTRIGLLRGQQIIDLNALAPSLPTDMLAFLQAGDSAMQEARKHTDATPHFAVSDVAVEAPIAATKNSGHRLELLRPRTRKQDGDTQTSSGLHQASDVSYCPMPTSIP